VLKDTDGQYAPKAARFIREPDWIIAINNRDGIQIGNLIAEGPLLDVVGYDV
jgi:hypothetical protein